MKSDTKSNTTDHDPQDHGPTLADAWRRMQAETLLRRCGFVEGEDGRWYDPTDPSDKGLALG